MRQARNAKRNGHSPSVQRDELLTLLSQLIEALNNVGPATTAKRKGRQPKNRSITISRLCKEYLKFADGYYLQTDGQAARESERIENGLRPLRRLFADARGGLRPVETEEGPGRDDLDGLVPTWRESANREN